MNKLCKTLGSKQPVWAGKRVHLGLILPSKFDCLFNPSLMDDLTQLMALFVSIIIFAFFLLFFTLCMK